MGKSQQTKSNGGNQSAIKSVFKELLNQSIKRNKLTHSLLKENELTHNSITLPFSKVISKKVNEASLTPQKTKPNSNKNSQSPAKSKQAEASKQIPLRKSLNSSVLNTSQVSATKTAVIKKVIYGPQVSKVDKKSKLPDYLKYGTDFKKSKTDLENSKAEGSVMRPQTTMEKTPNQYGRTTASRNQYQSHTVNIPNQDKSLSNKSFAAKTLMTKLSATPNAPKEPAQTFETGKKTPEKRISTKALKSGKKGHIFEDLNKILLSQSIEGIKKTTTPQKSSKISRSGSQSKQTQHVNKDLVNSDF